MEENKDKLIDDLNDILKENFDYIPIFKIVNIVNKLIQKGWKFSKIE